MKPLQVLPTRAPLPLLRWLATRDERTPMGGRVIHLGAPRVAAPVWVLALAASAPMLLVGMATMA